MIEPQTAAAPEVCPYLGLLDDPQSRFAFAAEGHRCFASGRPCEIDLGHQDAFCLSDRYADCDRYPPLAADRQGTAAPTRAGTGRTRRRPAVSVALILAEGALLVAIGFGAIGRRPSTNGTPGTVASFSAAATTAVTPAPTLAPTPAPTFQSLAPSPTAAPTPIVHVVQPGETLSSIAERYGVTVQALQTANGIVNPSHITGGQRLVIPPRA